MSNLKIYPENDSTQLLFECTDGQEISAELEKMGIKFERWAVKDAEEGEPLEIYGDYIDSLKSAGGYQTADVVQLKPDNPNKQELREKFLSEHTHSEDEVRFFVHGSGLFYLHLGEKVFAVTCMEGDLLSVPANTRHWFDMGPEPEFTCIRLFTDPAGWVAELTGDPIADAFPLYE